MTPVAALLLWTGQMTDDYVSAQEERYSYMNVK